MTTNPFTGLSNAYSGGIAGQLEGSSSVQNSYFTGSISFSSVGNVTSYLGGIVGRLDSSSIEYSYSTGVISSSDTGSPASSYSGGIAGYLSNSPSIDNSYFDGNASVKIENDGVRNDSYQLVGEVSGTVNRSTDITNSNVFSTANFLSSGMSSTDGDIFHDWDANIWNFGDTTEYPILQGMPALGNPSATQSPNEQSVIMATGFLRFRGGGTSGPYLIPNNYNRDENILSFDIPSGTSSISISFAGIRDLEVTSSAACTGGGGGFPAAQNTCVELTVATECSTTTGVSISNMVGNPISITGGISPTASFCLKAKYQKGSDGSDGFDFVHYYYFR